MLNVPVLDAEKFHRFCGCEAATLGKTIERIELVSDNIGALGFGTQ
jgi:hypothetical protein